MNRFVFNDSELRTARFGASGNEILCYFRVSVSSEASERFAAVSEASNLLRGREESVSELDCAALLVSRVECLMGCLSEI
ncbi:hypothetical protein E2C01_053992 [Portunus trituberculatus]|uniref:Uncharacterized protein n=1 Tax=Portunus trituberculatus TaxID=210409 RepID=A0A5B7GQV4_PORTR|nr:hypothetical protein [Portunus trituberculatus]